MRKSSLAVYIAALLAMAFWSLSFIWYKEVLTLYRPVSLVLMRLVISSVFLFIVTLVLRKLQPLRRADVKNFLILTAFQPFLYFLSESYGISMVSSTLAAVIISTIPLFSPIGAYFILGERISVVNFIGILVSVVGVTMVVFHSGFSNVSVSLPGVLLMFVAVAAAIGYAVVIRRLSGKYNVFSIVAYQNSLGILYFLPLFLWLDADHFFSVTPTRSVIIPLVNLGIFSSTIAFILFTYVIKRLSVSRANVFTNAIPVLTAIFAYLILGESLTPIMIFGIAVVVLGVLVAQLGRLKENTREVQ
jgi:drug/metabolite transporter (DMT)-like permease